MKAFVEYNFITQGRSSYKYQMYGRIKELFDNGGTGDIPPFLDYCSNYTIEVTLEGYKAIGNFNQQLPPPTHRQNQYPPPKVTIRDVNFTELTCSAR